MKRPTVWLVLGLASSSIAAADIFRWIDDNGVVHYGDAVPERYRKAATTVQRLPEPTAEQRQDALDRGARERARAEAVRPALSPPSGAVPFPRPALTCEEQKRRYEASQLCFHPFRNATGGIKAEAFQYCEDVKEPRC